MKKEERLNNNDYFFEVDQRIHTESDGNEFISTADCWSVEELGLCFNFNLDTILDDSCKMGQFIKLVGKLKTTFPKVTGGLKRYHLSQEELKLLKAMAQVYFFYDSVCEKLTFHPYVDAVMKLSPQILGDLIESCHVFENPLGKGINLDFISYVKILDILNHYMQIVKSAAVADRIDNIKRGVRKNTESIMNHFQLLLENRATLLVIRIDLGYQARLRERNRLSHVDLSDVINDRKCFFAGIKKRYPHWVGYVWKLEFAPKKGFHYHLILYFNGEQLRADGAISLALANLWKDIAGERRGVSFLCNLHKDKYAYPAIGAIHYKDREKIKNFKFIAEYLSKNDLFSSLKADKLHTMGKSQISPEKEKRGRPRTSIF